MTTMTSKAKLKKKVSRKAKSGDLLNRAQAMAGAPMSVSLLKDSDPKGLSVDDVCTLIAKCKESSVLSFNWAGLQVVFKETEDSTDIEHLDGKLNLTANVSHRALGNEVGFIPDVSGPEVDEYDQLRLDELAISDPLGYEQAIANGDLEDAGSES